MIGLAPALARPASQAERAHGALAGLALGDALGMPTQAMPRELIAERFGAITTLVAAPADQPISPGQAAGAVTDDTEQALIVARLLIEGGGRIAPGKLAGALGAWEERMIERGSHDLLGPSTKAALAALKAGADPSQSGRLGTTNGAAMRVAPVGIAQRPGAELWRRVQEATTVTHGTTLGLAGAHAVAAAVSCGIDGREPSEAVIAGIAAAHFAAQRGVWVAGADIAARFDALAPLARELPEAMFAAFLYEVVGTSVQSQESVVAALLLVERYADEPFAALTTAASLGGDTDTIAAIAGAILGACRGVAAFPAPELATVSQVNQLDLAGLSARLLALRS
ncbi:MAG: ADP-ribosylglycohydrolase family protein [Bifidobacteriaceae bacterium]|nr:ADP-ribosylglycohydrolase family protein [Bifidobacteriaceae bacterium]